MDGLIHTVAATTASGAYDILVGTSILPEALSRGKFPADEPVACVVSSCVYDLHRDYIDGALSSLGDRLRVMIFDDSEENKNYTMAGRFLEQFIKAGLTRKSTVIGIGGGVVGDFAGFCAGVYMRGIPVIHVPTTLLAMVDSSIGGKMAVNLSVGKNIVGVFQQPSLVVSDIRFLGTLSDDEMKNGLTEALKHGILGDTATLEILKQNDPGSIRRDEQIAGLVALSAVYKSLVVEKDETESGLRAILNFGHTIGHALESYREYRGISHGGAVAAGMRIKIEICRRMGHVSDDEAGRVNRLIEAYGLMPDTGGLDIDRVIEHMAYDKKNFGGAVNFILLKGLGDPQINQRIPVEMLREVMSEVLAR